MSAKTKPTYPQNADLKCKDCGSTRFSVHVEVHPNGEIRAVELECAACAVDQIPLDGEELRGEYLDTTLSEEG